MLDRYKNCFNNLKSSNQGAFVPFVMLGDPDLATSYKIITCLIENGADALELGLPFSDPIADGPVIQAAAMRALNNGASIKRCFELVESIRQDFPDIPIGLLVYSNLVVGNGLNTFYELANQSGVDSVLVADVPVLESAPFVRAAEDNNIQPIFIATPNATEATLEQVAKLGAGYTYLLSRAGVTGTDVKAEMPIDRIISQLKKYNAPPSLLGFGISTPEQVKQALKSGADGAISGSAIVKIIENNLNREAQLLEALADFVTTMKNATQS